MTDLHPGRNRRIYQLLNRYRATADPATGRELTDLYAPFIGSIVSQHLTAEFDEYHDAFNTAVIGFYSALRRFDPRRCEKWLTYVHTTILGYLRNDRASRRKRLASGLIDPQNLQHVQADKEADPHRQLELTDQVDRALNRLNPLERNVIERLRVQHQPYSAIASDLHLTVSDCLAIRNRATAKLRGFEW
jgi:RNA polymerase sigma factor (sigma-70 family)